MSSRLVCALLMFLALPTIAIIFPACDRFVGIEDLKFVDDASTTEASTEAAARTDAAEASSSSSPPTDASTHADAVCEAGGAGSADLDVPCADTCECSSGLACLINQGMPVCCTFPSRASGENCEIDCECASGTCDVGSNKCN